MQVLAEFHSFPARRADCYGRVLLLRPQLHPASIVACRAHLLRLLCREILLFLTHTHTHTERHAVALYRLFTIVCKAESPALDPPVAAAHNTAIEANARFASRFPGITSEAYTNEAIPFKTLPFPSLQTPHVSCFIRDDGL